MRTIIALVLLLTLCACKVGPNYKRPAVAIPDQYRGLAPSASPQPSTPNFAAMKWWTVFQDRCWKTSSGKHWSTTTMCG